ncbi:hypothetical protein CPB85DRAFT_1560567 [Mucidula mucida]|nr:hypothetical protein CPB85DRAFT_1560567 [Mucidula mucida]
MCCWLCTVVNHQHLEMAKSSKKRRTRVSPLTDDVPAPVSISADVNTKGLPTFPMELHLEILSYITSVPIPYMGFGTLPEEYRVKFDVMFALSQTCRALYHMLRPLLWHTLGACVLPQVVRKSKAMATELVLWMEVVTIRAPALGSLVRVFNVALSAYSSVSVYKEFARCLSCLENLHTLQIVAFPNGSQERDRIDHLYNAFRSIKIPSLHTLTLPYFVYERLLVNKTFPNLRHLALTGMSSNLEYQFYSREPVTPGEIHTLHLMPPPVMRDLKRFLERFPHLRATPRLILSHSESYSMTPSQDPAMYRARYLKSVRHAFNAISQLTRLHSVQPVIDPMQMRYMELFGEVDPLIVEGVFTIAKNFVLGNLNRDENGDVVSGTVKLNKIIPYDPHWKSFAHVGAS